MLTDSEILSIPIPSDMPRKLDGSVDFRLMRINRERAVAQAQERATLKAVGEWLEQMAYLDFGGGKYILVDIAKEIEALKNGNMPKTKIVTTDMSKLTRPHKMPGKENQNAMPK